MNEDANIVNQILPPEIAAQMPSNLTRSEQMRWRRMRIDELRVQQEQNTVQDQSELESAEATSDDIEISDENKVSDKNKKPKTLQKRARGALKLTSEDDNLTSVRNVSKSIFISMKRIFPKAKRNSDMMEAAAYILTDGDCEISPEAMALVKSYKPDDSATSERLARLERGMHAMYEQLSSIELGICYDLYDRRYGAKERRKSPKENEFREQGNLDMLHRLRIQAKDQRKLDDIERGRSIYEQTKDKYDKKD